MKTFGPYSPIRQVGSTYYLAGHTPVDPATGSAPIGITDQTKQALENLKTTLASADLSLNNIVKTTVFLADMGDFATMNEMYVGYFDEPRPVRSTVAVKELPRIGDNTLLIEIEAVAYRKARNG